MRYGILGPLEVGDGEGLVPLSQGRQRLLLAVLLLHANEPVSRDRLVDALWGEAPPPTAAGSLHNLVSGLRKALGDGALVTQGHSYTLSVADGELDADCFDALVDQGRAELARGDPELAAARLREALDLWRGPALADLVYEPAALADAMRLEESRLAALEDRIEADLALGRHAELVGELEALVAQHPLRERLRGQQILALYRCGRQADALRAYGDARRGLVEELGIEPGPALRELERAVLEHDPALGMPDPLPPVPSPRSPAPGRLARIRRPAVLALAGALLVAGALVALQFAGGESPGAASLGGIAGDSLIGIDPDGDRIVVAAALGGTPTSVTVGADAVWALNADDQTIARVDPRTARVRTLGVAATPTDLAAAPGTLWVASGEPRYGAHQVRGLGADDFAVHVEGRLPAPTRQGEPGRPGQLAVGRGSVWAINDGQELSRLDPRTGRVTATVRRLRARAVAVDGDNVWVLAADEPTVVRVDPRTATVSRRIPIHTAGLDAIATGAGALWAVDAYEGSLWRIDPDPSPIAKTIPVGVGADGVAVGEGAVWVINGLGGTLVRVDPRRNRVVSTVAVGHTPRDVAVGAGKVWVTLAGGAAPVTAAASTGKGVRSLPASACGRVFNAGSEPPDYLIASDVPLKQGPEFAVRPVAAAVAFVLRRHGFRAGPYRLGYQSCDSSTAIEGGSDPKKCAANAKAYAAAPALLGIVGPYESGCAEVEIPILGAAPGGPVAMVSPSNSAVGLTHRDPLAPPDALSRLYPGGVRHYARVFPALDAEAAALAFRAKQLGLRRVFVLDDGGGVRELGLHFRRSARAIGLGIAGSARWDTRFGALAERIARAGADGVFFAGIVGSDSGRLVRVLRERLGAQTTFMAANPFGPVDFLFESSQGAAAGTYISSPGLPTDRLGARGRRFLSEFRATQPGIPIRSEAVYAAAATEVLLDAIARSDGTRASVSRQLLATRLRDGILGPVSFNADGDLTAPPVTIMRVRARDGISDVWGYEGAEIDRVITLPPSAIR